MADSKAVSIRIPDYLLVKIDKLAEEKYTSIKGKPNRSLVIQNAIVAYFDTLSDSVSTKEIITLSDIVSIVDFKQLQDLVATLLKDVEQLQKAVISSSDTVIEITEAHPENRKALNHTQLSVLTVEEIEKGLTVTELAERFRSKPTNISSQKAKLKLKPEKFIEWSKKQDPDGFGWEFRDKSTLFYRVLEPASLSEGEAEAQINHP